MKRLKRSRLLYFFIHDEKRRFNRFATQCTFNIVRSATLINHMPILQMAQHLDETLKQRGFLSNSERKTLNALALLINDETFAHYIYTKIQVEQNEHLATIARRYKTA